MAAKAKKPTASQVESGAACRALVESALALLDHDAQGITREESLKLTLLWLRSLQRTLPAVPQKPAPDGIFTTVKRKATA